MKHGKPSQFLLVARHGSTTRPQRKAAYGSKGDSRKPSTGVFMSKGAREGAADSIPLDREHERNATDVALNLAIEMKLARR